MMRIYHHSRIALLWSFLLVCPGVLAGKDQAGTAGRKLLDGNLQVVDLSDLDKALPLDVVSTTQILRQTEAWEHSTWKNPNWPAGGGDSVGFPSLVKNDRGPNPDGKYYLFYAHHDARSGIGVAVADAIKGPYSKQVNVPGRTDNQVVPAFHAQSKNPDDPDHTSSPWVVWSEEEQLWFMYFHYFNHIRNIVPGFQLTAMATTPDLASNKWTIWQDPDSGTTPPYRPVLPTTSKLWANSASSYNTVHRLPDGRWLAFIRGTSSSGAPPALGFAASVDGRNWDYFDENPIIHQKDGGGRDGVYRPGFLGWLGKDDAGKDKYLVAWEESHHFDGDARLIFGTTTDFKTVTRDPRGHVKWQGSAGAISAWREGDRLYLFSGKFVHEVKLPVAPTIIVKPSDDFHAVVEAAASGTMIRLTEGTFRLTAHDPYAHGIRIENKTGITIIGAGRDKTIVKLDSRVDTGFLIGSNVDGLTIAQMHIEGSPPLATNTTAIGTYSAVTEVRDVICTELRIDRIAVGFAIMTDNGSIRGVEITNCVIANTEGVDAGWGYGIHTRNVGDLLIARNLIEHATRHSLYVRGSPAGTTVTVEDNLILNHDLRDRNPRWYCAAFNCAASSAKTTVTGNIFINPHAIGIAIMATGPDVVLINNQMVGEHYVGIWPTTGQTHLGLGNTVVLHPGPRRPEWCHKVSTFDWPNNKPTSSRFKAPNERWEDPDHVAVLGTNVFVMKNGALERIDPDDWSSTTYPMRWENVRGMTALQEPGGKHPGHVYILTDKTLHRLEPESGRVSTRALDLSGTQFVAAAAGRLCIMKNGRLVSIDPRTLDARQGKERWNQVRWMGTWGGQLYIFSGQTHYRVAPATFERVAIDR